MATLEDIARETLASIDSDASLLLAGQWVNARYRQLASKARLRSLRRLGTIALPARVSAGTLTATRGSTTVVGNVAATTAWAAASLLGRHVRVRTAWYEIAAQSGNQLVLNTPFAEDGVAAVGYSIVQRFAPLPREVRHLGTFVFERHWTALTRVNLSDLDRMSPTRSSFGGPRYYAEATPGADLAAKRVELYPYSETSEVVHYTYWADPPELNLADEVPGDIPAHCLKEGALVDLFRYEAGRQMAAGNVEAAGFYRNESRAQRTQWEQKDIPEAIGADTGSDDVRFIAWNTGRRMFDGEIMSARDQVWSR